MYYRFGTVKTKTDFENEIRHQYVQTDVNNYKQRSITKNRREDRKQAWTKKKRQNKKP